jgi:cob(I)alamin adenosyltransferase
MDKKTIIDGLLHALDKGQGNLDDLDALLNKAKEDIAQAKAELKQKEEEETRVRAQNIAELATRLLNNELTSDDVALVLGSYMKTKGIDNNITAEEIEQCLLQEKELDSQVDELINSLSDLFSAISMACDKKSAKAKDNDDTIDKFLKSIGVR